MNGMLLSMTYLIVSNVFILFQGLKRCAKEVHTAGRAIPLRHGTEARGIAGRGLEGGADISHRLTFLRSHAYEFAIEHCVWTVWLQLLQQ